MDSPAPRGPARIPGPARHERPGMRSKKPGGGYIRPGSIGGGMLSGMLSKGPLQARKSPLQLDERPAGAIDT